MRVRPLGVLERDLRRVRRGGAFGEADRAAAERVVRAVRRRGDAAVLATVRRFDRPGAEADELVVTGAALRRAARRCPRDVRAALDLAHRRIRAFHERQAPRAVELRDGHGVLRLVPSALRRVGALVPRGATSYPSTALMTGIPARIAGVPFLVAASPMPRDGTLDPALAYALALVDCDMLYRAGGAAAVAALAYGTASVPAVDAIVGPGNAYAAAAKWLVSAGVGIDALQGPSELIVVASREADPGQLVLDLLAQAEHGSGAFAALVSDDDTLLRVVSAALAGEPLAARVLLYRAPSLRAGVRAADDASPEHVLLAGPRAAALSGTIERAGCVFVGSRSAVAFGDYVAGTNHSLPTGGTARWSSALRVDDFVRWTSRVELRAGTRRLARAGAAIARWERMRHHADSMEVRD